MVVVVTFVVALLLTVWLASGSTPFSILDAPNERSLHQHSTAQTGGLAIVCAITLGWSMLVWLHTFPEVIIWIACAALLVVAISFMDDVYALSPMARVLIHAVAACFLIADGLSIFEDYLGIAVTWLAIVWMLNLYNFMDGMDGFAAGMTVTGFTCLGAAGWMTGNETYAWYCWVVAASALGFLPLNFPPARIFMGDAGSATLGLLAAGFSLWGIHDKLFPLWFPLLIFSPFVVDATVTLVRRCLHGDKIWQAHRVHYYQRLVQAGWGHKKTVLMEYALMSTAALSAIMMLLYPGLRLAGLIVWLIVYILLAYAADGYCARQKVEDGQEEGGRH